MEVHSLRARQPKYGRARDDDRAHRRGRGKCRGRGHDHARSVGDVHNRDRGGKHCMVQTHRSLQYLANWNSQSGTQHLDKD